MVNGWRAWQEFAFEKKQKARRKVPGNEGRAGQERAQSVFNVQGFPSSFFQGKSGIYEINDNFSLNALCSGDKIQVV